MRLAAWTLLLCAAAAGEDGFAKVSLLQMPEGTQIRDAIYEDVDGDRAPDLVIAGGRHLGPRQVGIGGRGQHPVDGLDPRHPLRWLCGYRDAV